jgi:CheY-like chemotaxis protein
MSPKLRFEIVPVSDIPLSDHITHTENHRPVILVVDDERVIADTLTVILSRSGFTVMTAYDGRSALELARAVAPQLLLSDVVMGSDMDGTELAIQVVREIPDCKVLLFSGHASTMDLLDKARDAGHNFTLLTKPVHPADLLRRISESFTAPAMSMATA